MKALAALVLLTGLVSAGFVLPAHAQQAVPDDLEGDWGTPGQCAAQREAGEDATVDHVLNAPYRFRGPWVSRWFYFCRVMQVDPITAGPLGGGFRVRMICGEDAVDRPWEVEIAREDDTLSMSWFSLDPEDGFTGIWEVGPLQRCPSAAS